MEIKMRKDENTVEALNQIPVRDYVKIEGSSGLKILFAGNSITRHWMKPEIGWNNDWGMAASDISKDYVHLLLNKLKDKYGDVSHCIVQLSEWERRLTEMNPENFYQEARKFAPNVIVMRIAENAYDDKPDEFYENYKKLIDFFNADGKAKVILTTSFWNKPAIDEKIILTAQERNYPLVRLGHLGDIDRMMALGKFEHKGVSIHPNDNGMEAIADAIYGVLCHLI